MVLTYKNGLIIAKDSSIGSVFNNKEILKRLGFKFNGYELKYWAIPHVAFLVSYRENKETWDRLLKAVKFIDKLDTKSTRPIAPPPIDVDYDYEPYQIDVIYKIFYSKNFLLCDDVGVGKSGSYIGYINLTNKIKGKINVLILCTVSGIGSNLGQILSFQHKQYNVSINKIDVSADINIVSYSQLQNNKEKIDSIIWDVLILDEGHKLKDSKTIQSKLVYGGQIKQKGDKKKILYKKINSLSFIYVSATPIVKDAFDLFPALNYIDHIGFNYNSYLTKYATKTPIPNGGKQSIIRSSKEQILRLRKDLLDMGIFISRTKKELGLQETEPIFHQVVINDIDYSLLTSDDVTSIQTDREFIASGAVNPSRIIDIKISEFPQLSTIRKHTGIAKSKLALPYIEDLLSENKKIVIFCVHKEVLANLMFICEKYNPVFINGDVPQKKRPEILNTFVKDPTCRVFIGNIAACGESINELVVTNIVLFIERDWSWKAMVQSIGRVSRRTQLLVPHIYFYDFERTIDYYLTRANLRKAVKHNLLTKGTS